MAARIAAERANAHAKTELVTMVSHEVRTPLNAVTGAAALLALTPMTAEQRELMVILDAGASHVCTVIDDLLSFAVVEKGSLEIKQERVNLVKAVVKPAWLLLEMSGLHKQKIQALALTKTVRPGVPELLLGDSSRIMQCLLNLLVRSGPPPLMTAFFVALLALGPQSPFSTCSMSCAGQSGSRWLAMVATHTARV